ADGFGCDWAELPREPGAELTLRLVKDVPVRGRVQTTEGKPVVGATVVVRALMTSPEGRLDEFLTATKQGPRLTPQRPTRQVYLLPAPLDRPGTTGPDGRFELRGVGAERLAQLEVRGPGAAQTVAFVAVREGLDVGPINRAAAEAELRDAD